MVQETCVNTRATDQMNRDDSVSKVLHFPDLQDTVLLQVYLYECIYPRSTSIKDFVTQTVRLPKQSFSNMTDSTLVAMCKFRHEPDLFEVVDCVVQ